MQNRIILNYFYRLKLKHGVVYYIVKSFPQNFFPCVFAFVFVFFHSDKRALIVYPQECYEVEQLVLFLVKQLNCIGIYPLTDLTQGQRVGEEGETVVMINDFEKATYIIILCTDGICKYQYYQGCYAEEDDQDSQKHLGQQFQQLLFEQILVTQYLQTHLISPPPPYIDVHILFSTQNNFRNTIKIYDAQGKKVIWTTLTIKHIK